MPEDTNLTQEQDHETQIAELRDRLTGHADFARWRGQLDPVVSLIEDILDYAASPTDALHEFDMMIKAGRPFVTMLAQLMRDDKGKAFIELKSALSSQEFVFTGEDVPIDQTVPVTVVMPVPEITKTILQTLHNDFLWKVVYSSEGWRIKGRDHLTGPEGKLRKKLLQVLPECARTSRRTLTHELVFSVLLQHAQKAYPTWKCLDLTSWPFIHWLKPYSVAEVFGPPKQSAYREAIKAWCAMSPGVTVTREEAVLGHMAVMIQAEQNDVLKKLGNRRADVATWQLRIPKPIWGHRVTGSSEPCRIIVQEESLHPDSIKKYPTFTSKGLSGGMSVLFGEIPPVINPLIPNGVNLSSLDPFMCLLV